MNRNAVIVTSVVLLHLGALWALQTGLLRRAVEVVVPVQLLSEMVEPPQPQAPPPPAPHPPPPAPAPAPRPQPPVAPPPPMPLAMPDPLPSPTAPSGIEVPMPLRPPLAAVSPVAPMAPPPAPRVELPSSDADYLQNPKPAYPPISKRLGEQGQVVIRVLIGVDGRAQAAEIRQSSGYERLDQAALTTVRQWRYVPGKRNGVAEAMWFNVPIQFVLE